MTLLAQSCFVLEKGLLTETTVSPQNSQPPPTRHGAGVLKVARAMGWVSQPTGYGYTPKGITNMCTSS